jgi:ribonuclease Z
MIRILALIILTLITSFQAFADMHLYTQKLPQEKLLNDDAMHIFFCGTGDPEIGMQSIRKPFCVAIIADNQFLVFDSGEGSSQNLGALGLPLGKIKHLFVTHWHSDHMAGIGYLNNVSWLAGRDSPLTMYGPFGVKKVATALNQMYSLDELYRGIAANGKLNMTNSQIMAKEIQVQSQGVAPPLFKTSSLSVAPFLVDHSPVYPALGYVIHYKNCKIVISGDTRVTTNLIAAADKANLLINEGFSHHLGEKIKALIKSQPNAKASLDFFNQISSYHSDTLEIAKMATKDQIKYLVITHLVPAIPTTAEAKAAFIQGMEEFYSGPITVVDDRDELVITSKDDECTIQYNPAPQPEIKTIEDFESTI